MKGKFKIENKNKEFKRRSRFNPKRNKSNFKYFTGCILYYEINKRNIPLELLSKLADYYNTSVDYLLYRTNDSKPYPKI